MTTTMNLLGRMRQHRDE